MPWPWPLTEVLIAPLAVLALAAALPLATGRALAALLLRRLPAERSEERSRRLAPFRLACLIVGLVQVQILWMAGARALGPLLVESQYDLRALLFGAAAASIGFAFGGVARRIEEPDKTRPSAVGAFLFRLRLVPFLAGPVATAAAASMIMPLAWLDAAGRPNVSWPWIAAALLACAAGAAYAGIVLGALTGAARIAPAAMREVARDAATREGATLALVLRLPTHGVHFPNAGALPWARSMIVTDRIAELLAPDELRAVLAHEAAHLTERPFVAVARIAAASGLLFVITCGARIAATILPTADLMLSAVFFAAALALVPILLVRRLARRMEERADAHAARTCGAEPLARALEKLHADAQLPAATGVKRVHPDLVDRLRALGVAPASPALAPVPPRRSARLRALATGLLLAVMLVAAAWAVEVATDVTDDEVQEVSRERARWRLRVDPWDPEAMLALAWHARRGGATALAVRRRKLAARMGAEAPSLLELDAELAAVRGDCARAWRAFDAAITERSRRLVRRDALTRRLDLGGYELPPTLVRRCAGALHAR